MSADEGDLKKQVDTIERCIAALDGEDKRLMQMRFFERAEVGYITTKLFISERAVYYRIEKIIKSISECL